jgi:flagella basal body P-ring formation protein FlgA
VKGLFGVVVLFAASGVIVAASGRTASTAAMAVAPAEAIARAVAERMGEDVEVEILSLNTAVKAERALQAMPEPGGRVGQPMRFVMMVGRARRGIAVATVKVVAAYARAARTIGRDETIAREAIEIVEGELAGLPLKRLPAPEDVVGLTARRDIAAGEPVTQALVDVPPLVRSGDTVVLTVVVGTVQVTSQATASVSGREGEVIRVVSQGGRALKARVTGPGAVEVVR